MGYGERPGTPRTLYPATKIDLEILAYPTTDKAFRDDAQAGLMCCICPIGLLDFPLAVVLDTFLLPYDMYRIRHDAKQGIDENYVCCPFPHSYVAALNGARTEQDRFRTLGPAANYFLSTSNINEAKQYAGELLALLPRYSEDREYGYAVFTANMVLGKIAFMEGRIEDAKRHLIAAGKTTGDSGLNTFGPDMSLAKKLLEHGEQEAVLEYLELCKRFWKKRTLNKWQDQIKQGTIPKF